MGLFHTRATALNQSQHGCLQISSGDVAQEAVRRDALLAACALLGAAPSPACAPRLAPDAPRQGAPPRLQGQAGLRYLPLARAPWWTQDQVRKGITDGKPKHSG